jgi:hypothetical protein
LDSAIKALKEARAIIADPARYVQNAMARDAHGSKISPRHPAAVCFCSMGALARTTDDHGETYERAMTRLEYAGRVILSQYGIVLDPRLRSVPRVNDLFGREACLRMYDLAINDTP